MIHDLGSGGAERVLVNLVNHLDQSKFDVSVISLFGGGVNEKKLSMVEKAEQFLLDMGFKQFRVRIHGENLARIEVLPADLQALLSKREEVTKHLRELGFAYVTMDLQGYRTGAMNEVIKTR